MIRAVLLDFYNTLYAAHEWFELEVRTLPVEALRLLRPGGRAPTPELEHLVQQAYRRVREQVHSTGTEVSAEDGLRRSFEAAGIPVEGDLSGVVARLQRAAYVPGREELGAALCVRALESEGYRLGIVSNALYGDFLRWSLEDSGLSGCFDGVFASADAGYYKASPELYRYALAALGSAPGETVHVGDSYRWDILGAKAAGIRGIWYSPSGEAPPGDDAVAVIRSLAHLPDLVRDLGGIGSS